MTDTSRLERIFAPLLDRHRDISIVGDWLVVAPVRHFIRGLWLQDYLGGKVVHGLWGVRYLWVAGYEPELDGYIEATHRVSLESQGEAAVARALCEEVETVTLPLLRSIRSLEHLYERTAREPFADRTMARFQLEVAMGHFELARAVQESHQAEWFMDDGMFQDPDPLDLQRTRELCRLLDANDHRPIASRLHRWEAIAAHDLGVRHLWQPSPFPFESMPRP